MFDSLMTTLKEKAKNFPEQYDELSEMEQVQLRFGETCTEGRIKQELVQKFLSFHRQYREAVEQAKKCLHQSKEALRQNENSDTSETIEGFEVRIQYPHVLLTFYL